DQAPVHSLALAPDGTLLASRSGSFSGDRWAVCLWDLVTGRELHRLPVAKHGTSAIAFSPDGRSLAAAGFRCVSFVDVTTGKELCRPVVPKEQPASDIPFIAFSPDGKAFAWVTYATCRVSETATGKELRRVAFFRAPDSLASISWGAFSADGRTLLLN